MELNSEQTVFIFANNFASLLQIISDKEVREEFLSFVNGWRQQKLSVIKKTRIINLPGLKICDE